MTPDMFQLSSTYAMYSGVLLAATICLTYWIVSRDEKSRRKAIIKRRTNINTHRPHGRIDYDNHGH